MNGISRKWIEPFSQRQKRPSIPSVWPIKIRTNLTCDEKQALENAGFHLSQKEQLQSTTHSIMLPHRKTCYIFHCHSRQMCTLNNASLSHFNASRLSLQNTGRKFILQGRWRQNTDREGKIDHIDLTSTYTMS